MQRFQLLLYRRIQVKSMNRSSFVGRLKEWTSQFDVKILEIVQVVWSYFFTQFFAVYFVFAIST
ncbi:MAG: hypothetical protein Ct9H90mP27_7260 [Gammaproteobacteria bacterium]|nr:MAG: hypothetical protein Ct9H90mP27_7260 [Gammaproteobacteria bacterium]